MNRRFDIVVIGDSKHGNSIVKKLAVSKALNIAFVSSTFKRKTAHEFLNVEYIKDTAVFIDYQKRLFSCYLNGGDILFSTHLIIASGVKYEQLFVGNKVIPDVFNTADDIDSQAKNLQAIVLGGKDTDVKLALAVAKKYKHVYLCTKEIELSINANTEKKLNSTNNIVVLPNASIAKFTQADGRLKSVELDNYATVTCSAIFVKTQSTPDIEFVPTKIFSKDSYGFLETSDVLESLLVPKCFAVGNCVRKSTKNMIEAMIKTIRNDFNGGKNT
jgi:thioredoxin reductase